MGEETGILRIEVDGFWTAADFSKLFDELEVLSEMAAYGDASQDEQQGRILLDWGYHFPEMRTRYSRWDTEYDLELEAERHFRETALRRFMNKDSAVPSLQVKEIRFASPGFVDLLGAGRIVGHISKFILGITDRYLAREDRVLAREQTKQKILKAKIANAESLLRLGSKVHMDPEARRQLVRRALEIDEYIESKLIDQKITAGGEIDPNGIQVPAPPRRSQ